MSTGADPAGVNHTRHDLAHQMATVRALVDAASDADLDVADRVRVLAAARAELVHASDLVAALGVGPTPEEAAAPTTDLSAVVEVAAAAQPPGRVTVTTPGPLPVRLARTAVLRVVRNLLGNALAAGDHVRMVVVPVAGGLVRLDVHDDGPGPGPAGFSRPGGSGLDIVRSLVLPSGGYVALGRSPDGGARATVVLPAGPR